jgi:flagellar basal-body rod protein FlgG
MSAHVATTQAIQEHYRLLTHNLANANTVGYKRRIGVVAEAAAAEAPAADSGGAGPATEIVHRSHLDFSQGRLVHTGRSLDVALHGEGFLVLEGQSGELYTRNGILRTNAQGQLVDAEGRRILGQSGPIVVPGTVSVMDVRIGEDGKVLAAGRSIGKLRIVGFEDASVLDSVGDCAFRAPQTATPQPDSDTTVHQGFQEASNVKVVGELVDLIRVSRLYEANLRALRTEGKRNEAILKVAMA